MAGLFKTSVVPDDPRLLPSPEQRIAGRTRLRDLMPVCSSLQAHTYEHLRLIIHARHWSYRPRPRCPGCRRRLDEQFLRRCGRLLALEDSMRRTAPCCGTQVALDADLRWPWDTGYAQFILESWGGQRPPRAKAIRAAIGEALGCPVRVYQEMPAGTGHLPVKG